MAHPLFAEHLLHALDGHAFFVQQLLDSGEQINVGGAIVSASSGAFDRLYLTELAVPEAEHMCRCCPPVRNLRDGAKRIAGFGHRVSLSACCRRLRGLSSGVTDGRSAPGAAGSALLRRSWGCARRARPFRGPKTSRKRKS